MTKIHCLEHRVPSTDKPHMLKQPWWVRTGFVGIGFGAIVASLFTQNEREKDAELVKRNRGERT